MLFIKAYANGGKGKRGTNTGNPRPRKGESMGDFYRRTKQSALGATPVTSGRMAPIREYRGK